MAEIYTWITKITIKSIVPHPQFGFFCSGAVSNIDSGVSNDIFQNWQVIVNFHRVCWERNSNRMSQWKNFFLLNHAFALLFWCFMYIVVLICWLCVYCMTQSSLKIIVQLTIQKTFSLCFHVASGIFGGWLLCFQCLCIMCVVYLSLLSIINETRNRWKSNLSAHI